jgi:hypothetical protein
MRPAPVASARASRPNVRGAAVEHDLGAVALTTENRFQLAFHCLSRLAGHRLFDGGIDAGPLGEEHAHAEELRKDMADDQRAAEIAGQLCALTQRLLGASGQVCTDEYGAT